jgi:hypothetical protein
MIGVNTITSRICDRDNILIAPPIPNNIISPWFISKKN